MNTEKKDRSILLWILVIASPLIAGWILGLVSGTNPLRLDAWNTGWNDENGYFRVIRTLRFYGMPRGLTGFNEITSGKIPYGPYNIFTLSQDVIPTTLCISAISSWPSRQT